MSNVLHRDFFLSVCKVPGANDSEQLSQQIYNCSDLQLSSMGLGKAKKALPLNFQGQSLIAKIFAYLPTVKMPVSG
ncbi:MAG: hypothetical protein CVV27_03495 [Candidatus Melainabacteria bacterium HGW-Melainabacteria-1]|nr:MAG: hypothetical protein CVV27_03495 [Candidatus Melainabacteria bacterium HGW-Melainabacteria-1]